MGRARDAILDALENLAPEELKKFKMKLLSVPLRQGFGRIPRGPLLQMDAIDLTDKLVSYYMEAYATELTMAVLTDMGMQELAKELQKVFTTGAHFVDQHRQALIARVTDIDGVLDALYGTVLSEEQYQAVRAETTNSNKMRKLFSFSPAWDLTCKNLFLNTLRERQPYLVADLEQS